MNEERSVVQHLLDECATVAENSLYTAQAHFVDAERATQWARLLFLIPSGIAAVAGMMTSFGLPGWIGAFAAASGLVTGVASALGADRKASAHVRAGNLFTALRHEARSLCEAYAKELSREQLVAEMRRLDDRYSWLIQTLEPTSPKAFEVARKRVKKGLFTMDFAESRERT